LLAPKRATDATADGMSGAVKTIAIMVLISLQPFLFRKLILAIAALLLFSALCFADSVFMARQYGRPVATASATEAKPTLGAPPAQIFGTVASAAPSEIGLWQSPAGTTDLLLQFKSFTLFEANPETGSDLARFQ
jgi:hypothetical protein